MDMDPRTYRIPPRRTLLQAFLLASLALTYAGYMIADFDHPPSHTHGGIADCGCPGDWAPDPGSIPTFSLSRCDAVTPMEFVIPGISRVPAFITGPAWWDDHLEVPQVHLTSLPSAVLLI